MKLGGESMDFEITDDQRMIRDMVRDFAQKGRCTVMVKWRPA